jgi:hypothetical protein
MLHTVVPIHVLLHLMSVLSAPHVSTFFCTSCQYFLLYVPSRVDDGILEFLRPAKTRGPLSVGAQQLTAAATAATALRAKL